MKIAVVGGGSTYTPELIDGLARLRETLPVSELALVDPAVGRLELIGGLASRILARQGHPTTVTITADLDFGVQGADAVLVQLRVGGQSARAQDQTWPLECGCVGQETTGAGGPAKALRTVSVRLCNAAIGFRRLLAGLLDAAPERIELDHVGLNHLTWERGMRLDGVEVLPELIERFAPALAEETALPADLFGRLGLIPSYYALLVAWRTEMKTEPALSDTSRVDTEQQMFLDNGNLTLDTP
jgi:6-phospho-beta-glucosidase